MVTLAILRDDCWSALPTCGRAGKGEWLKVYRDRQLLHTNTDMRGHDDDLLERHVQRMAHTNRMGLYGVSKCSSRLSTRAVVFRKQVLSVQTTTPEG